MDANGRESVAATPRRARRPLSGDACGDGRPAGARRATPRVHARSFAARALAAAARLALLALAAAARGAPAGLELAPPEPPPDPLAAATIVVFNTKDLYAADLAGYYAQQRGIRFDHVVGLDCPTAEEITRDQYDRTIALPLRQMFLERDWWRRADTAESQPPERNLIRFIALIRGIPLKIAAAPNYPGDSPGPRPPAGNRNEAAVDSELATLGLCARQISGFVPNPYFRAFSPILDANRPDLMLVSRLDGPSPAIVRRMIDDAIATERSGLAGFCYVDTRGIKEGGYAEGDEWLRQAAADAQHDGMPTILDAGDAQFAPAYPLRHAALYYGWYSQQVAGPIARPDFAFARGAVAAHIHSWSAGTVRDPAQNWVGPLLAKGAAATVGNVYEPYLTLTCHLGTFQERLRAGFTFAESAYMATPILSWMATVVGDPLYRPFRLWNDALLPLPPPDNEWAAYRQGARAWFTKDRARGEALLAASARALRSGIIWEGLGLLQAGAKDLPAAFASFAAARKAYKDPGDIQRTAIHEINLRRFNGQRDRALALARSQENAYPKSPATEVIRAIAAELAAPATSGTTAR